MRWLRATLAYAAIVAGCSSLEGLSGNDADSGAPEAGIDGASSDAPLADASGSEAASDGSAPKGCKGITADYCIDFDDGVFPGQWTVAKSGAGTIGIDGTKSYSPSGSMLSSTNGTTGDNGAGIRRPTGPSPDVLAMQARIQVEEGDPAINYDAFSIYFAQPNNAFFFLDLEISAALDLYVQQLEYYSDGGEATSTREAIGLTLRPGQWAFVKLTYTVATSKILVELAYDDAPVQSRTLDMRGAPYRNAGEVQFADDRVQAGAKWRVRYDDVALDITP